jgi:hypothetical protein
MPGPIPKPPGQARRPNRGGVFTYLPAAGREGAPPVWPLGKPNKREAEVWASLWRLPQAVAWEAGGAFNAVIARYARIAVQCEGESSAALLGELRQMEDRLGLNPVSLAKLRWQVVDQPPPELEIVVDIRDRLSTAANTTRRNP